MTKSVAWALALGGLLAGQRAWAEAPPANLVVWKLGSQFNLAAVLSHRSKDPKVTEQVYAKAKKLAQLAGVELPKLPPKGDLPKLMGFLGKENRTLAQKIAAKHGKKAATLFDMASMSMFLLLVYEFEDPNINKKFADGITQRGKETGLPEKLWQPVVKLIQEKASFAKVRSAVLTMDDRVADHLGAGKFK